jgi:hypothetical protein
MKHKLTLISGNAELSFGVNGDGWLVRDVSGCFEGKTRDIYHIDREPRYQLGWDSLL